MIKNIRSRNSEAVALVQNISSRRRDWRGAILGGSPDICRTDQIFLVSVPHCTDKQGFCRCSTYNTFVCTVPTFSAPTFSYESTIDLASLEEVVSSFTHRAQAASKINNPIQPRFIPFLSKKGKKHFSQPLSCFKRSPKIILFGRL